MKAVTLIQPWATAVMHWGKPVENRSWAPPAALVGQRIAIHAGKKLDVDAMHDLVIRGMAPDVESVPQGVILGTVRLDGWIETNERRAVREWNFGALCGARPVNFDELLASAWLVPGGFAWVLSDPEPLATPIPCKGAQGLWNVPADVLAQMGGVL